MDGLTPQALWTTIRRGRLIQVLAFYLGTSFLVLEAVDILTDRLGLPDWVFPGAVVLLLIGLPIILTTALVQRAPARSWKRKQLIPSLRLPKLRVQRLLRTWPQWRSTG